MKIDRQIEILQLVKRELKSHSFHSRSICTALTYLKRETLINDDEHSFIKNRLNANKPTPTNQFQFFTKSDLWNNLNKPIENAFWWMPSVTFIRADYIDALIYAIKQNKHYLSMEEVNEIENEEYNY